MFRSGELNGSASRVMQDTQKRLKDEAKKRNDIERAAQQKRVRAEQAKRGMGYTGITRRSNQEKKAGIVPVGYEGVRNRDTGELLAPYKTDPYAGEALQALKTQAFAEGDSPWAKMQLQKQEMEQSKSMNDAAAAQAQGIAQAQSGLMRQGGLSSGARTSLAKQGARDLMMARQGVAGQGAAQRLDIQEQDLGRKQDLLGKFGAAETQANQANIGALTGDITRRGTFDMERYKQQMAAYGAEKGAEAQRAAAGAGGKK
jgi:hypothetical protein